MKKKKKINILSWGGGVNSTAILAMVKLGMLPKLTKENTHIVFADTCAEMPYTYEHTNLCLSPMARDGWVIATLNPNNELRHELYSKRCRGLGLPDYCVEKQVMPSRINRWCTMEYKSKPVKEYRKSISENWLEDTVLILGIASDEKKRAKFLGEEHTHYPLIEQNIDRQNCLDLCKKAQFPTPRKSGCYFCPYQSKKQWLELYYNHKDLFQYSENLENIARKKYGGKAYYLCRNLPIREQIKKWLGKQKAECSQEKFDFVELDRHCFCGD